MAQRSTQWYAGDDRNADIHRAWMRRGVPDDAFRRSINRRISRAIERHNDNP